MRRLGTALVLLAACVAGLSLTGASSEGEKTYRVDALFYNAAHLIPGQLVKIAGAEVGEVEDVKLTHDRRARVQMKIDERFGPFRADAKCRIRPQSLIGEKFVQCDPGSSRAPELRESGDEAPTVPLKRNEVPVDLDLVFASLRMPYRQRLSLIVNELGTGLAGRPEELNDAIRLANPALGQTRRVLEIVDADRARLARLIDASDEVIGELAERRGEVQGFIGRAGEVGEEVASRRGDLDLALRELPPMLAELEPTARDLETLATQARPVLSDLRAAAPGLRALAADFGPLNDAARPALVKLADMSKTGRRAVRAATPVAELLRPVARRLPPVTGHLTLLLESLRDNGAIEGILGYAYNGAISTARFDRYSHILPTYQIGVTCNAPAERPAPGCDAHFAGSAENPGRTNDRRRRNGLRPSERLRLQNGASRLQNGLRPSERLRLQNGLRPSEAEAKRSEGAEPRSEGPQGRSEGPEARSPGPTPPPPQPPVNQLLDFLLGP